MSGFEFFIVLLKMLFVPRYNNQRFKTAAGLSMLLLLFINIHMYFLNGFLILFSGDAGVLIVVLLTMKPM